MLFKASKLIWIVRRNKSIMTITNKLEKVHADFWGLHDLLLLSKGIYAAILMCEHI